MNNIPPKIRAELATLPRMKLCARRLEGGCSGRITWEHALIYAGKQVQEVWAILGLCDHHHLGSGLDKEKNHALALAQATPEDLAKYPRSDWVQKKKYLLEKYSNFLTLWFPQKIGKNSSNS